MLTNFRIFRENLDTSSSKHSQNTRVSETLLLSYSNCCKTDSGSRYQINSEVYRFSRRCLETCPAEDRNHHSRERCKSLDRFWVWCLVLSGTFLVQILRLMIGRSSVPFHRLPTPSKYNNSETRSVQREGRFGSVTNPEPLSFTHIALCILGNFR